MGTTIRSGQGSRTPSASSDFIRRRMERQARRDTGPEIRLRRVLHAKGLRFRLHRRPVEGLRRTVDLVFPRDRIAVEVRGCYWHSCPDHGTMPKSNTLWWTAKLAENRRRDQDTDRRLREAGWGVVVVWEHEDPEHAADRILALLRPQPP